MLAQRHKRLLPLIVGALIFLFVVFQYNGSDSTLFRASPSKPIHEDASHADQKTSEVAPAVSSSGLIQPEKVTSISSTSLAPPSLSSALSTSSTSSTSTPQSTNESDVKDQTKEKPGEVGPYKIELEHREIFSLSTADKKFFSINFGHKKAINPNIIPHPHLNDTWIIVGMLDGDRRVENSVWVAELVCNAVFQNDTLSCVEPPQLLPIAATHGAHGLCKDPIPWLEYNIGPHDARVFYSPIDPYIIYGSNSEITCFGQWILDFRLLIDWGLDPKNPPNPDRFRQATEMQRPKPIGQVEKNYFLFWDDASNDTVYAHYDIYPKRAFAKLEYNGVAGPDLAPATAAQDEKCLNAYLPSVDEEHESIHQATNSLKITLCKRFDSTCIPSKSNTFILTIFQHKIYHNMHAIYEPYVMLFSQSAPFEIHAISKKPLWISGRGVPGGWKKPDSSFLLDFIMKEQTQLFYVTSMSWKNHGMKYSGYIDDVMFLAFGIEDADTGGIDILAGDLLQDLGICSELP